MSRRAKRALGWLTPKAHRQLVDRLEELEARLTGLDGKVDAVPGVVEDRKDWFVLVGGQKVELRAISPAEWLSSLEELPSFLFAFATERVTRPGGQLTAEMLQQIHELASRWIRATAIDPETLELERLTLPEAEHAVVHISELNGVTAHMRAWFRQRLEGVAGSASGSEELRDAPQQPPGDLPN